MWLWEYDSNSCVVDNLCIGSYHPFLHRKSCLLSASYIYSKIFSIMKLLSYLYLQNNRVAMTERHDISNARAAETVATVNITDSLKTCSTPPPHSLKYNIFVIFGWYNFFIDCQPAPFNAPRMKDSTHLYSKIISPY